MPLVCTIHALSDAIDKTALLGLFFLERFVRQHGLERSDTCDSVVIEKRGRKHCAYEYNSW